MQCPEPLRDWCKWLRMSEVLRRTTSGQRTVPATDIVLVDVVNLLLQKIGINQPTHFSFPAIKLLMTNIACLLVMELIDDILMRLTINKTLTISDVIVILFLS